MKRCLSIGLRLVVALVGVWFIALSPWGVDWDDQVATLPDGSNQIRPGVVAMLRDANYLLLFGGLALTSLIIPFQTMRWLVLMRCRGLVVSFAKAIRLQLVGMFFNFCMPGLTGGDVVKAYYAAKGSGRRGAAIMSVVFDRLTGTIGLLFLAGCVGLLRLGDPLIRRLTMVIWIGFAVCWLVAIIYFSRTLRRLLGLEWVLSVLPAKGLLGRIDEAAVAYRDHKWSLVTAVVLSLPVHLAQGIATALAGFALGMSANLLMSLLTILPVLFFVGAVPITFLGFGTMEPLGVALLKDDVHATTNQIVGMLILYRLFQIVYGLMGSLLLLRGEIHLFPENEGDLVVDNKESGTTNLGR